MTIKFIARIYDNEGYGGDANAFDTLEEANEVAYIWWSHLTDSEKKTKRTVICGNESDRIGQKMHN